MKDFLIFCEKRGKNGQSWAFFGENEVKKRVKKLTDISEKRNICLALTCRSGGSICPQPLYLVLTTADGHKYVSRVALMQSGGVRLAWQFAEATITRGEMLTLEASYTPDGNTADDAWVGCLGISTASAAEGQCQGTNGQWYNILPVIELGMKVAARPLLLTETQQQKLLTLLQ